MKKSIIVSSLIWTTSLFTLLLAALPASDLFGQLTTVSTNHREIVIPNDGTVSHLYVALRGGDGGDARAGNCWGRGGSGAIIQVLFEIGKGTDQLPPGSTLLFVRGKSGSYKGSTSGSYASNTGSDGEGSGLFYHKPGASSWTQLAIAGGGEGGIAAVASLYCTKEKNGAGGNLSGSIIGNGNLPQLTLPGNSADSKYIGGYTKYEFNPDLSELAFLQPSVKLSGASGKCLDFNSADQNPDNGANIRIYDCSKNKGGQQWYVNEGRIRSIIHPEKCIDLTSGKTNNGTNIQLWDCKQTSKNQFWVYDGIRSFFRSGVNHEKCLDIYQKNTANGTNIEVYDCQNNRKQKWEIAGATLVDLSDPVKSIRPAHVSNKCMDLQGGSSNTGNGANIQIWTCTEGNTAQQWYLDNEQIKLNAYQNKCLDLDHSNTDNSTNIQLWDCNNSNAQKWIYDGITRRIHSAVDPTKCLDVFQSGTANGTNIQIWDCHEAQNQQFVIE